MFFNEVYGIAGNMIDKYLEQQVPNKEGEAFANKIGAFFKATSAKNNTGIIELFKELGKRYIDPNYRNLKIKESEDLSQELQHSDSLKLEEPIYNNEDENKNKNKNKKWYLC